VRRRTGEFLAINNVKLEINAILGQSFSFFLEFFFQTLQEKLKVT